MNFLNKLIPFESLYNFNSDSLTAYWVLATIIIFVVYIIKLFKQVRIISNELSSQGNDIDEYKISTSKILNNCWEEYADTFFDFNKGKKTYDQSIQFFGESHLFHNSYNIKWLQSVPTVLVGIGILGTFVGLTVGISDFNTKNTIEIQNSITKLLSGMGTAFVSSIWGMSLSLIYSYLEKAVIHKVQSKIIIFCKALDKKYMLSKKDEKELEFTQQKKAIAEYFIYLDENNNIVKPSNVLRDIFAESQKQSLALQTFSTDLAIKIESGFENILSTQFQEKIVPILEEIKVELQNFSNNIKNPAGEMTQAVVLDLKNVMNKMVNDFKDTISDSTKSEISSLINILSNTSQSLKDMPEVLGQSSKEMKSLVEMLGQQMNEKVGELQIEQEILIDKQRENIQLSDKYINEINAGISRMNETTTNVTKTLNQFYELINNLNESSSGIKALAESSMAHSKQLRESEMRLIEQTDILSQKNQNIIDSLVETMRNVTELANEQAQKYLIIEKGLKGIFEQIQSGVIDYSKTIAGSVKDHLEIYTKALTSSVESLSSSSSKLEATLDELTEQLDKFNNGRR